jgi:hypothetical protein
MLVTANVVPSSPILVTRWWRRYIPLNHWFLQEPHSVTSQKMAFFIGTAVKTSNLIDFIHIQYLFLHTGLLPDKCKHSSPKNWGIQVDPKNIMITASKRAQQFWLISIIYADHHPSKSTLVISSGNNSCTLEVQMIIHCVQGQVCIFSNCQLILFLRQPRSIIYRKVQCLYIYHASCLHYGMKRDDFHDSQYCIAITHFHKFTLLASVRFQFVFATNHAYTVADFLSSNLAYQKLVQYTPILVWWYSDKA